MVVGGGSQGPATGSLFGQGLAGGRLPVELGPGSAAASGNDTYISEEDERVRFAKNGDMERLARFFCRRHQITRPLAPCLVPYGDQIIYMSLFFLYSRISLRFFIRG
jgi:hypothetical protein